MSEETKIGMEVAVNSLIEGFDDLEDSSGVDFTHTKRFILRWAQKHHLFIQKENKP